MSLLLLKIILGLVILHSLLKMYVFFFVSYKTRRKMLDTSYNGKASATKQSDWLLLGIVILIVVLLFISQHVEYISFAAGLYVGMTLIQTYFHSFSKPLTPDTSPAEPSSPIKIMSYAIQANPGLPWKQLLIISLLFIWVMYMLLTHGFGWFL